MADMEGTRHLAQLNFELDGMLAASNEELAADLTKEELNAQIEKLELLKIKLKQREEAKQRLAQATADFKLRSSQLVEMPADYQEVAERISEEVFSQVQMKRSKMLDSKAIVPIQEESEQQPCDGEFSMSYEDDGEQQMDNESELLKFVQSKLNSSLYGFNKPQNPTQGEAQGIDPQELKRLEGIARIRALDKILKQAELEEKAIKRKIRQEREEAKQKRLEEIKAQQEQDMQAMKAPKHENSQDLSESQLSEDGRVLKNKSGVSHASGSSSKSDFFMTQNKKIHGKGGQGEQRASQPIASIKDSSGTALMSKGGWKKNNPQKPSSQSASEPAVSEQRAKSALDAAGGTAHIEKNIREAFNNDRGSYPSTLTGEKLQRYNQLFQEAEQALDKPELIRQQVDQMFLAVYGYPQELQEKFKEIDERIREMTTPAEKAAQESVGVDPIKDRADARALSKKLRQIDERLQKLDADDEDIDLLDPLMLEQKLALIGDPLDQQALMGVRPSPSLEEIEDPGLRRPEIKEVLERLQQEDIPEPEEGFQEQEYIDGLDFDQLEHCMEGYISSLDELSTKIKAEEQAIMQLDTTRLEAEKNEIEKHMLELQAAIRKIETFEADPEFKIRTELDAERLEERLNAEIGSTEAILEQDFQEFWQHQAEIERLQQENQYFREQLLQVPMRSAEHFDQELRQELAAKYPYMFSEKAEADPEPEDWEQEADLVLQKYLSTPTAPVAPDLQPQ